MLFVGTPAELAGLANCLGVEAVDWPGILESSRLFRLAGDLRIVFRNMDNFYPELLHQTCPFFFGLRDWGRKFSVMRDVEKRLFDEMRDDSRVCAMGRYGGYRCRALLLECEQPLAEPVVRLL